MHSEDDYQEWVKDWLAGRPVANGKPFWWDNPRWNADNLSVIIWFEKRLKDWLAGRPAAKRGQPLWWDDPQWNAANLPVVGVSWFEAQAYGNWLTILLHESGRLPEDQLMRLPTEAEWEKTARTPLGPPRKRRG